MEPYRVMSPEEPPPPLPPLPVRSVAPAVAFLVAVAILALGAAGLALWPKPRRPAASAIAIFDAERLIASFKDDESVARLHDTTVLIRGVFREFRHDSFGNDYFEIGTQLGYEVPIIQCFVLPGQRTAAPSPEKPVRVRARLIGMSLGVALQADECVREPGGSR